MLLVLHEESDCMMSKMSWMSVVDEAADAEAPSEEPRRVRFDDDCPADSEGYSPVISARTSRYLDEDAVLSDVKEALELFDAQMAMMKLTQQFLRTRLARLADSRS
jgi:hypothetical protein